MNHDIFLYGFAFGLRPVELADAEYMIEIRTKPELTEFLPPLCTDPEAQRAYLTDYFERDGDYYFVVERISNNHLEGNIAVYDVDTEKNCAEWGRWILDVGSRAAIEGAWLIYRVAFEILELEFVYCRTNVENTRTLSFHDSCGLDRDQILPNFIELNGKLCDAVEHRLTREKWPSVDADLRAKSELVSKVLSRGA